MAENNSSNVILIDPNKIEDNVNINAINSVPQYQDMYIFAELTAKSKGRTVIINGETNNTTKTDRPEKINFIGNNQDTNNPNYLNFTTNYYDGSTGNAGTQYESFGINNIKIKINSSFIPQIDIQFVDIRGLTFFNQDDSPYRILFDFPPPVFTLTVKGYYGKPISYDIHLVKYTSEFNSKNGNFIIDAQFVAVTFAPLTDILFRYVVNSALINDEESMNPDPNVRPKNTFQLILQLKSLYSATSDLIETENENSNLKSIENNLAKIDLIMEMLEPENFRESEVLKKGGRPYLITTQPEYTDNGNLVSQDRITIIQDLAQLDSILKEQQESGVNTASPTKIYLVYVAGINFNISNNDVVVRNYESPNENNAIFENPLRKYKRMLLSERITSLSINDNVILDPNSFYNSFNIQTNNSVNTKYYGIDITEYYTLLYRERIDLKKEKDNLNIELTTKINAMVSERLGMKPSIYNIFKIILDDVDKFFTRLKKTVIDAADSHNNSRNKKILLNDDSYNEEKNQNTNIYPFPLIVETTVGRRSRIAPIELSKKVPFPELTLVDDFIKTFGLQANFRKQYLARENQNDDGVNEWIPISPFDSTLGGASSQSPYLNIDNNIHNDILRILVERFYILSQGTLTESFYPKNATENLSSDAYVKLYAEAEAINLASTLLNEKKIGAANFMCEKYIASVDNFYTDIDNVSTEFGTLYEFPTDTLKKISIGNEEAYTDKYNAGFKGVDLNVNNINYQNNSSNRLITKWINKFGEDSWWNKKLKLNEIEFYFNFTTENLLYIKDVSDNDDVEFVDSIQTFTRYIVEGEYLVYRNNDQRYSDPKENNYSYKNGNYPGGDLLNATDTERQTIARNSGNNSFTIVSDDTKKYLNKGNDIINVWTRVFGLLDNDIIDTLTGTSQHLSSILILSNFGNTASPFNTYGNALNSQIFDNAAAIQVPAFYSPYIGGLLTALENNWDDEIFDYFTNKNGKYFINRGFYVLSDLHDIDKYLSDYDKQMFMKSYEYYITSIHEEIVKYIGEMYNTVNVTNKDRIDALSENNGKLLAYLYLLNPNSGQGSSLDEIFQIANFKGSQGSYFNTVLKKLIQRKNIINYSQITFKMSENYPIGYKSIKTLNDENTEISNINNKYFQTLFSKLKPLIGDANDDLKNKNDELQKIQGDENIINQLYYSFKNINDKWLTGSSNSNKNYPFNKPTKNLIDSFAFVDRGMNPIGETIINAEILTNMLEDPNITLFSALSQLLSLNGFEFFPLQNFLSFKDENKWTESFGIYTGGYDTTQNTQFVCMYIGGSSSYPSTSNNGFKNDGIIDIEQPNISGFSSSGTETSYEENVEQLENNKDVPWKEVRAFKVKFGEQNQSMFTDMKIDSKEYPETNESIQILSRLAGDNNPDAQVPIGQNLYNLYENRSYKATVTGLGNATIQPTQYFQLENIPLFNGAYIILDVEHDITPNKMTTSFSGTKLLEYPIPRVLKANALTSYDGKSAGDAVVDASSYSDNVTQATLDRLNAELGVDVSHWNGNCDWNKAKENRCNFAIIKLSEGADLTDYDSRYPNYDLNRNIIEALDNNINLTYYHLAKLGRTSDPEKDGRDDANNFITMLNNIPDNPKLPVALDIENDSFSSPYRWSNRNSNISTFVRTFIETVENAGYDIIIYSRKGFIDDYNLNSFSDYPLWIARWMNPQDDDNVETAEPPLPNGWKNWIGWQFTSFGKMSGVHTGNGRLDLNIMRKDFFK